MNLKMAMPKKTIEWIEVKENRNEKEMDQQKNIK